MISRARGRRWLRIWVVVLVLLVVAGGVVWYVQQRGARQPAGSGDPRLTEPTRGNLAADQGFLSRVRAAWQRDLTPARMRPTAALSGPASLSGSPSVYWAGDTPAGPAAVVLQSVRWPSYHDQHAMPIVIGLVGTDPRGHRLALLVSAPDRVPYSVDSFAFGPNDSTVVTLAESGFTVYSPRAQANTQTGWVDRDWEALPYVDGVAVVDVGPEYGNGRTVVELAQQPSPGAPSYSQPSNQPLLADSGRPADPRLHWPIMTIGSVAPPPDAGWDVVFDDALSADHDVDPFVSGDGYWQIVGQLDDSEILDLGEEVVGTQGRLYAVLVSTINHHVIEVRFGGTVDPGDPLPVRFRLPDAQNWLVAAYGSTIGTPSGTVHDVAVVPVGATVVVTPPGGQPQTIRLAA